LTAALHLPSVANDPGSFAQGEAVRRSADMGSQLEHRVIPGGITAQLARMSPASLPSTSMEVSMLEHKFCRIPYQARSAAPRKE
jgi:hypothetical protein